MKTTDRIDLPYFDYGLFKPGELAFKKIEEFLDTKPEPLTLKDLALWQRDGVPLLGNHDVKGPVDGFIFRFIEGQSQEAYKLISTFVGPIQYSWNVLTLTDMKFDVNVLWGIDPEKNSDRLMELDWTIRRDPIFKEGLDYIGRVVEEDCGKFVEKPFNWERMFRLQMTYLFLWTAIERYCYYAYGLDTTPEEKREALACEESYQNALKEVLKKSTDGEARMVYRPRDLNQEYRLNYNKPGYSLRYYYGIRTNITHRGKEEYRDADIVRLSLIELYQIFQIVLKKTLHL